MTRVFLALNLPLDIKQDIFALYHEINTPKIKWTAFDNWWDRGGAIRKITKFFKK